MRTEKILSEIEQFIDDKISDCHLADAIDILKYLIENTQIKLEGMIEESEDCAND